MNCLYIDGNDKYLTDKMSYNDDALFLSLLVTKKIFFQLYKVKVELKLLLKNGELC